MSAAITWLAGSVPPGADSRTLKRLRDGIAPGDETVVVCDFSGPLAAIDCDKITGVPGVAVIRNDGGSADLFSLGTPAINEDWTRVSVWLGGGTPGFEYLISVTVQSNDGQRLTRSFISMHSPIVSRLASVVEAFSSAFSSAFGGGGTNPVGKNTAHGELAWRLSLNAQQGLVRLVI
jgi:hypothetical protein